MKNKIIIVASVILMLGITTVISFADTVNESSEVQVSESSAVVTYNAEGNSSVKESGKLGDNIIYTLYEDGTLNIKGFGKMKDFYDEDSPLYNNNSILKVNIEKGITNIGYDTFNGCTRLRNITIPEGVTNIGGCAFSECSSLTSIDLPEGITSIGGRVFSGCSSLRDITIPKGVTNIGGCTFSGCSSLTSINLPEEITSIEEGLFSGCSSLTSIDLPEGITSIEEHAFENCSSLTSINVPEGVTNIWDYTFYKCENLTNITLPKGIKSIGWYAFNSCSSLTSINLPEKITSIDDYAFEDCSNLTSITLPEGLTSIGQCTFDSCSSLTIINLPEGVTSIGNSAFRRCISLTSINLPEEISSIGGSAFEGCISLTSIDLPKEITSIGKETFRGCSKLASITIPNGVTKIGDYAFEGCSNLISINLPEGITIIGDWTFRGCSNLVSVTIPKGVTSIGNGAFYGCKSLTNITLPKGVTKIGAYAFEYCNSLTSINLPEGIISIGEETFRGCSNLASITIPKGVTSIGEYAFCSCSSLTSITIPDEVTSIGNCAFYECKNLTNITISKGVKIIGYSVFYRCSELIHVVVNDEMFDLGKNMFGGSSVEIECIGNAPEDYEDKTDCDNIQILYHKGKRGWTSPKWHGIKAMCVEETDFSTLNDSNYNNQGILFTLNESAGTATVGDNSDTSCNSGYIGGINVSAVIPDTVVKDGKTYRVVRIGKNAFSGNSNIPSITLGKYVSSVDVTAFRECANFKEFKVSEDNVYYSTGNGVLYDKGKMYLYIYPQAIEATSFTVPETVKTIGTYAFAYAENLENIYVGTNVTSIGENTFYGCSGLKSITLPFIGTDSSGKEIRYIFNNGLYYSYNPLPSSLKNITILGGNLGSYAFRNCSCIESIILPDFEQFDIPYSCFSGCSSLKYIQWGSADKAEEGVINVPESYTSIENGAFSGCTAFRKVIINKNIDKIYGGAFSECTGLVEFSVDKDNKQYMSDKWGVLYTKDQSTLMYYPTQRIWPYYNVSDKTKTIESDAFYGTSNLVNLLVPNNVMKLDHRSIDNLNGATICVYKDSAADTYCKSNNLTAWYMDNYEMQGIRIYHLPEQTEFDTADDIDFKGLYMASYGGKDLQLEDYSIEYDPAATGKQTVTVRSGDYSTSFEITVHSPGKDRTISFDHITGGADRYYVAAYDSKGKLLCAVDADVNNGKATADISYANYTKMSSAKLFAIKEGSMAPADYAIITGKKSA